MVAQLTVYFTYIIEQLGYWGAGFLMALESMIAPVPSELVMPFVGFLAAEDKFSIPTAILVTSLGSLIGSLISYFLGLWGGRPLVLKAGRYFFLNHEHLEWSGTLVRQAWLMDNLRQPFYPGSSSPHIHSRRPGLYEFKPLLYLYDCRSNHVELILAFLRLQTSTKLDTCAAVFSRTRYRSRGASYCGPGNMGGSHTPS